MRKKKRLIGRVSRQLITKKVISLILDDFAFYGSLPFYIIIIFLSYFLGNQLLFQRLLYGFILSFIIIISIKSFHYKDRPQKEEFNVFVEKILAASFPSSHSMAATVISILIYISYPYFWVLSIVSILSLLVFLQRYISKKHFVIDIIGGIAIAIAEAIFIIRII